MRFSALDGWRGIAALLVALYHFNAFGHFYALPLVRNSDLFVDFFFVLSGFVISFSSYDRLITLDDGLRFLTRRFGRVWPLHAVMLLAFIALPLAEWLGCYATGLCGTQWPFDPEQQNAQSILSNLLLVHALGLHTQLSWNWPSWSISVEFFAYVLFALAATAFRTALFAFASIITVACAAGLWLLSSMYGEPTSQFGLVRCILGFFSGFLIFRLYASRKLAPRILGTPLEIAAVVLVFGFLSLADTSKAAIAAPLVFGFCVYVFAHEAGGLSRLLKTRPFLRLGEWSYSIYMVHAFVCVVILGMVRAAEKAFRLPIRVDVGYSAKLYYFHDMYLMDAAAALYLLTVVALSSFTYRVVEDPARKFFNALATKRGRKSVPGPQ